MRVCSGCGHPPPPAAAGRAGVAARIRHAATAALAQIGIADSEFLRGAALALSEAVGNAIKHAYPDAVGDIEVAIL